MNNTNLNDHFKSKYILFFTSIVSVESEIYVSPDKQISLAKFSYYLYDRDCSLIIALGQPYNSYEKFILLLDVGTWICSGVFFSGAFLTIMIINKPKSQTIRELVYGHQVTSQNILKRSNFERYLLILFIIFCLIIRTEYQGVQFEMTLR
jgi:hypothetical protein